jgi:hypothetical protein
MLVAPTRMAAYSRCVGRAPTAGRRWTRGELSGERPDQPAQRPPRGPGAPRQGEIHGDNASSKFLTARRELRRAVVDLDGSLWI